MEHILKEYSTDDPRHENYEFYQALEANPPKAMVLVENKDGDVYIIEPNEQEKA